MKMCLFCNVLYEDTDDVCWKCEDQLVEAKECPSCGEWMEANYDICDPCHMDWVRKFLVHAKAFREEITEAQMENFKVWGDEESLIYFYHKLRKAYPNEPR